MGLLPGDRFELQTDIQDRDGTVPRRIEVSSLSSTFGRVPPTKGCLPSVPARAVPPGTATTPRSRSNESAPVPDRLPF